MTVTGHKVLQYVTMVCSSVWEMVVLYCDRGLLRGGGRERVDGREWVGGFALAYHAGLFRRAGHQGAQQADEDGLYEVPVGRQTRARNVGSW